MMLTKCEKCNGELVIIPGLPPRCDCERRAGVRFVGAVKDLAEAVREGEK